MVMEIEAEGVRHEGVVAGAQLEKNRDRALLVLGSPFLDDLHQLLHEMLRPNLAPARRVGGQQEEDGERLVDHGGLLVVEQLEQRGQDAGLDGSQLVAIVEHEVEDGRGGVLLASDGAVLQEVHQRRYASQGPNGDLVLVHHGQAEERRRGVLLPLHAAVPEHVDDQGDGPAPGDEELVGLVDGEVEQRGDGVLLHLLVGVREEADERRDAGVVGDEQPVLGVLLGQRPDLLDGLALHVEVGRGEVLDQRGDDHLGVLGWLRRRVAGVDLHLVLVAPLHDEVLEGVVGRQGEMAQRLLRLGARPLPCVQPFLDAAAILALPVAMMTGSVMISREMGQRKSLGIMREGHFSRYLGMKTSPRMFFSSTPAMALRRWRRSTIWLVESDWWSLMSFLMAMVSARRSARLWSWRRLARRSRMGRSALLASCSLLCRIIIRSMASSMSCVSVRFLLRFFSCALISSTCSFTSSDTPSSAYGIPSSAMFIFSYTPLNLPITASLSSVR
ncbi:Os06g0726850 [Oryza sativa Japonica Group]|uniref:Os06g0726850 protein n=1 Tax=Oryza sativa subsp. japonica TaxID=39947 RepID=A0A0P0X1L1_ORYSJ|nr:hypothetical protein EE612_036571 [Oryza sativa]BAS99606.1 Os06g0726850 [Oryza sativa Japonica Group]